MNLSKGYGYALIIGASLLVVTLALHPVGGDLAHLQKIFNIAVISHSIAIVAVPLIALGHWGLTVQLNEAAVLSKLGLTYSLFGLIAVMIGAALNGIVLMTFVQHYNEVNAGVMENVSIIARYNASFNHAMVSIFIGTVCISTCFWSIAILKTTRFPAWLAYAGLAIVAIFAGLMMFRFTTTDLHGFSVIIFGMVFWNLFIGYYMIRNSADRQGTDK